MKKFRTPKNRMIMAELNQPLRELEQLILRLIALPFQPANLVYLAISVVVPLLRPAEFIAA